MIGRRSNLVHGRLQAGQGYRRALQILVNGRPTRSDFRAAKFQPTVSDRSPIELSVASLVQGMIQDCAP